MWPQCGVFCCVGGGPKQLFKIKLWKSPTVNIGLASATGISGRMCKSHLVSFHNAAVAGRQKPHPDRLWVLSALKDITYCPEERLNMLKHAKLRWHCVSLGIATAQAISLQSCVVYVCVWKRFSVTVMFSEVGLLCKKKKRAILVFTQTFKVSSRPLNLTYTIFLHNRGLVIYFH